MRFCVAKHAVPGTDRLVQVWMVDYQANRRISVDRTFYVAVFEKSTSSKTGWDQVTLEQARDTEVEARTLANEIWVAQRDAARVVA